MSNMLFASRGGEGGREEDLLLTNLKDALVGSNI